MRTQKSHPNCWTGDHYEHRDCHRPSGALCVERGCARPAGTLWGPNWCAAHDVERLDRIGASLSRLVGGR